MVIIKANFPFETWLEGGTKYYRTIESMSDEGFTRKQMWSVCSTPSEDHLAYCPAHMYRGHIGYVATSQQHDENTIYYEKIETAHLSSASFSLDSAKDE
jgi:hypothetical protein